MVELGLLVLTFRCSTVLGIKLSIRMKSHNQIKLNRENYANTCLLVAFLSSPIQKEADFPSNYPTAGE